MRPRERPVGGVKAYLAARPVYRFKDDVKGVVLKATIGDIAIVGETLVIDLSPIKLTATVAFWLLGLALVLFVAVWLVRRPGWGANGDPVRR